MKNNDKKAPKGDGINGDDNKEQPITRAVRTFKKDLKELFEKRPSEEIKRDIAHRRVQEEKVLQKQKKDKKEEEVRRRVKLKKEEEELRHTKQDIRKKEKEREGRIIAPGIHVEGIKEMGQKKEVGRADLIQKKESVRKAKEDMTLASKRAREATLRIADRMALKEYKYQKQRLPVLRVFLFLFGVIIFITGIFIIYKNFFGESGGIISLTEQETIPLIQPNSSIDIPLDRVISVDTKQELLRKILLSAIPAKNLIQLSLMEAEGSSTSVSLTQFLDLLQLEVPEKVRTTVRDDFFFGVYGASTGNEFVLVIPILSISRATVGMREWELTIYEDLKELVNLPPLPDIQQDNPLRRAGFRDVVLENINTRILYGENAIPLLMHAFIDDSLLIIARGEEGFKEVVRRVPAK